MAEIEEHYILRVQDKALAERLRKVLREDPDAKPEDADIELAFKSDPRQGSFRVGADEFSVSLKDLPTIVETYKTYDDAHLVKCTDVGQVQQYNNLQKCNLANINKILLVSDRAASATGGVESRHGVTPPMRDARRRHFRPHIDVAPSVVSKVEEDLLAILRGGAPEGVEYVDQEEEYVVDAVTGSGAWKAVGAGNAPISPMQAPKMRKKPGPKSKQQRNAEAAAAAAAAAAASDGEGTAGAQQNSGSVGGSRANFGGSEQI